MSEPESSSVSEQSVPDPRSEEVAGMDATDPEPVNIALPNGTVVAVNAVPGSSQNANPTQTLDQTRSSSNNVGNQCQSIRIRTPYLEVDISTPFQPRSEGTCTRVDEHNEERLTRRAEDPDRQGETDLRQNHQVRTLYNERLLRNLGLDPLDTGGDRSTNVIHEIVDQENDPVSRHDHQTNVSSQQNQLVERNQQVNLIENTNPGAGEETDRKSDVPDESNNDETDENDNSLGAGIPNVNNVDLHNHGTNDVAANELPGVELRAGDVGNLINSPPNGSNVTVSGTSSNRNPSSQEIEFPDNDDIDERRSHPFVAHQPSCPPQVGEGSRRRLCMKINEVLNVGVVGPIVWKHEQFFIVIVDAFSRLVQLTLLRVPEASDVVEALKRWKREKTQNLPEIQNICTDGTQLFNGPDLQKWCDDNGVTHDCTSDRAAHANEVVRGAIRSLKEYLNDRSYRGKRPFTSVKTFEAILNRLTDKTTEFKPAELVWGRIRDPDLGVSYADQGEIAEWRIKAYKNWQLADERKSRCGQYERDHGRKPTFQPGSLVEVWTPKAQNNESNSYWIGPFGLEESVGHSLWKIEGLPRPRPKNQLRLCI